MHTTLGADAADAATNIPLPATAHVVPPAGPIVAPAAAASVALPAAASVAPPATANLALPATARDELAAAVAAIWAELLAVDAAAIGPDSDFHALGGDSLQMVQLFAAIGHRIVGADLEPRFMLHTRAILRRPTLAGLCAAIRDVRRAAAAEATS